MRIHFIAIGGAVMHNLAIALKNKGNIVTGSDDEIFDPAYSKLKKYDLLPKQEGWFESNITIDIDAIILGMHAKSDNLELAKAKSLNIPIYSFPEFIYEQSKNQKRIVIGGSHGKTSTTAMIMHVLGKLKMDFDFMVGAQLEGFELTVRLSNTAPIIILEGDEYPDSAINKTPKFHLYKADIAVITGIAWDHINVFPTYDLYKEQFKIFAEMIPKNGALIFCKEDIELDNLISKANVTSKVIPYSAPQFTILNGATFISSENNQYQLSVFGKHNLQNMMAAKYVCNELGISDKDFLDAIQSFTGASKRLELVSKNDSCVIYKDFAHSPSKLKATIAAVKEQFPNRKLTACLELHTYSSLNKNFLSEYKNSMSQADEKFVYYNEHTLAIKKLEQLDPEEVKKYFGDLDIVVITDKNQLIEKLKSISWVERNLLMMSSGTYDGLNWNELSTFVTQSNFNHV